MTYFRQFDISDCGPACLAMIFSHYKKNCTVTELRAIAGTDINGTTLIGLKQAAEKMGFNVTAVRCSSLKQLEPNFFPCIAHTKPMENNIADHYVVLKGIRGNRVCVYDPNPDKKKYTISIKDFCKKWTGILMLLNPSPLFKKDSKNTKFTLRDFLPIVLNHKKLLIYALLSSILILALELLSSFSTKYIYDEVIFSKSLFSLNAIFVGLLTVGLLKVFSETIRSVLVKHFTYKTDSFLNFSFVSHLLKLPISFFESRKTGEILSRLNDLAQVRVALSSVTVSSLIDILMVIIIAPFLFVVDKTTFVITIICTVLMGLNTIVFGKYYKNYYQKLKEENAESSAYLVDVMNGISVVKAFDSETVVKCEYEKKQMKAIWSGWKISGLGISQSTVNNIIHKITSLLIMWFGCISIFDGEMSLGMLLFLVSLSGYFINPLLRLVNFQSTLQESLVSARRVGEILCLDSEISLSEKKLMKIDELCGDIEFRDVCFHYGSRPQLLNNLSFCIQSGTSVGLVGNSGCGKTTIIKLLLKFYNIDSGKILINGNDISDIDNFMLRKKIGYVPQDTILFPDSIGNNISMCDSSIALDDIISASKLAGIHDYIISLPDRYNTRLGENGSGLSGGEKQRISIARALLQKPSILILDEATSNLDTISEHKIHSLLMQLKKQKVTVIIISHRETTICNCDQVVYFEDGRVVCSGRHKDLLDKSIPYRQHWEGVENEN